MLRHSKRRMRSGTSLMSELGNEGGVSKGEMESKVTNNLNLRGSYRNGLEVLLLGMAPGYCFLNHNRQGVS